MVAPGVAVAVGAPPAGTVTIAVAMHSGMMGEWSLLTNCTEKICVPGMTLVQVRVGLVETTYVPVCVTAGTPGVVGTVVSQ